MQERCLYGKLILVRQAFIEWVEEAKLILRRHLTLRKLLMDRDLVVQNAKVALFADVDLECNWRMLCANLDTCTVRVALSTRVEGVAVQLACGGGRLEATHVQIKELGQRLLTRFLHTRSKYFFQEVRELVNA